MAPARHNPPVAPTDNNNRRSQELPKSVMTPLIRQCLAEFCKVTGLVAKLVPATPPQRPIRFGQQDNAFCRRVWSSCEGGCVDCHHTQQELFSRLGRKLRPQSTCCAGGVVQLAVPVLIAGNHVATVLGGKVRLHGGTDAEFQRVAARLGFSRGHRSFDELHQAYFDSPVLSRAKFQESIRLLDTLARLFGETLARQVTEAAEAPSTTANAPYVSRAKAYVKENLGEPLTTRAVAHALNLSESYFCRLFRRVTGTTFHNYLAHARVEAAKARLRGTLATITEICYVSGFQSVSDFNRVFKAKVGTSPSNFRRGLRPPGRT